MMKKFMQSPEAQQGFRGAIEHGVRLEYLIENYYDRSVDGKLKLKPELHDAVREMFEAHPK